MKMLARVRERAMEKCREVPPEQAMQFEARRLRSAQNSLGLIALLDDSQLCGIESRRR
ncbi:hypothetical protein GGI05_007716, partial [Coemansia sp. RSA 2603]